MNFAKRQTCALKRRPRAVAYHFPRLSLRCASRAGARRYQSTAGGLRQGLTNRDGGWQRVPPPPAPTTTPSIATATPLAVLRQLRENPASRSTVATTLV